MNFWACETIKCLRQVSEQSCGVQLGCILQQKVHTWHQTGNEKQELPSLLHPSTWMCSADRGGSSPPLSAHAPHRGAVSAWAGSGGWSPSPVLATSQRLMWQTWSGWGPAGDHSVDTHAEEICLVLRSLQLAWGAGRWCLPYSSPTQGQCRCHDEPGFLLTRCFMAKCRFPFKGNSNNLQSFNVFSYKIWLPAVGKNKQNSGRFNFINHHKSFPFWL